MASASGSRKLAASLLYALPSRRNVAVGNVGLPFIQTQRYFSSSRRHTSNKPPPKSSKSNQDEPPSHRSQYNYDPFTLHPEEKHQHYPLMTAQQLSKQDGKRPRQVRMLTREFIHDSLYNPHYGYFSKQAVLLPEQQQVFQDVFADHPELADANTVFNPSQGFDFNKIRNEAEFMRLVDQRYHDFEKQVEILAEIQAQGPGTVEEERKERVREGKDQVLKKGKQKGKQKTKEPKPYTAEGMELAQMRGKMLAQRDQERVDDKEVLAMAAKQVWHTPTQIFRPYYARAIARYLVAEYKLNLYPYHDLIIYEVGAGSGALAHDILDYLYDQEPEIYLRTRYRIIEISERLANEQKKRLQRHVQRSTVDVINRSILEWNEDVPEPCFVIALEVFDNLAHDVVRYSTTDMTPYQAIVSIDDTGDMHELWEPVEDPLIKRYLDLYASIHPATVSLPPPARSDLLQRLPSFLRKPLLQQLPFYPNLTQPHYLPTASLMVLDKLKNHFPHHRLVLSDFDNLPDSCQGVNAPVVQTRHQGVMVPVTTYLVLQGHFDIFFPTNFHDLEKIYNLVMSSTSYPGVPDPLQQNSLSHDYFNHNLLSSSSTVDSASSSQPVMSPIGKSRGIGQSRKKTVKLYSHPDFLQRYGEVEHVQLKDGSVPMLSWYDNASWFLS